LKRLIYAMSKDRSDLAAWIEDHTFPVMCAIAQLYLFENVPYRAHWRQEVWSKFCQMHVLRSSKKLPSSDFIYDNSWGVNKGFVDDAINWAISHEYELTPRSIVDSKEVETMMDDYFIWLSNQLSNHRAIPSKDVYSKLDELGLKESL